MAAQNAKDVQIAAENDVRTAQEMASTAKKELDSAKMGVNMAGSFHMNTGLA